MNTSNAIPIARSPEKQDYMKQMLDEFKRYFGLHEMPFSLLPNTSYYVDLPSHQQCFSMLMFAIASGEGMIKIIGEVGTGKTLLCRRLLNSLDDNEYYSAYIPNPNLNPIELKRALAKELQVENVDNITSDELMGAINSQLLELALQNQKVVLVIDEAQSLPEDSIEAMRLFTNLETESQKLMQIVMFAQPELDEILKQHQFRQILQRITFSQNLTLLNRDQIRQYINHRLTIAGYNGESAFNEGAVTALHSFTKGVPRLISILSGKSLLIAFSQNKRIVTRTMINRAAMDTECIDYQPKRFFGLI